MGLYAAISIVSLVFIVLLVVVGSSLRGRPEAFRNRMSVFVILVWILALIITVSAFAVSS